MADENLFELEGGGSGGLAGGIFRIVGDAEGDFAGGKMREIV